MVVTSMRLKERPSFSLAHNGAVSAFIEIPPGQR
jgi:hypothetical protein